MEYGASSPSIHHHHLRHHMLNKLYQTWWLLSSSFVSLTSRACRGELVYMTCYCLCTMMIHESTTQKQIFVSEPIKLCCVIFLVNNNVLINANLLQYKIMFNFYGRITKFKYTITHILPKTPNLSMSHSNLLTNPDIALTTTYWLFWDFSSVNSDHFFWLLTTTNFIFFSVSVRSATSV